MAVWPLQKIHAQLYVSGGAKLNASTGTYIVATGTVGSAYSFLGAGTLVMKGTATQKLNMNGTTLPKLEINNSANVILSGNAKLSQQLIFTNGKLQTGAFGLLLESSAIVSGAGAGKFVENTGTGKLRKVITANVSNLILPVGNGVNYTPLSVTTSATYSSAEIAVNCSGIVHPNKPTGSSGYLNMYWSVVRTGITGSVNVTGSYVQSSVVGTESLLKTNVWNGSSWSKTGGSINITTNQVTAQITGTGGDLYAMSDAAAKIASASLINDPEDKEFRSVVYPNPTTALSTIEINFPADQLARINIIDARGRIVRQQQVAMMRGLNRCTVQLDGLSNGTYTIRLQSGDINKTFTVIKQ